MIIKFIISLLFNILYCNIETYRIHNIRIIFIVRERANYTKKYFAASARIIAVSNRKLCIIRIEFIAQI